MTIQMKLGQFATYSAIVAVLCFVAGFVLGVAAMSLVDFDEPPRIETVRPQFVHH